MPISCNKLWMPFLSYGGIYFQNFRATSANFHQQQLWNLKSSAVTLSQWYSVEPVGIFKNSLHSKITAGKFPKTRSWLLWQTSYQIHWHSWSSVYAMVQPCATAIFANVNTIYHTLTCANALAVKTKGKGKIMNLTETMNTIPLRKTASKIYLLLVCFKNCFNVITYWPRYRQFLTRLK